MTCPIAPGVTKSIINVCRGKGLEALLGDCTVFACPTKFYLVEESFSGTVLALQATFMVGDVRLRIHPRLFRVVHSQVWMNTNRLI